MIPVKKTSENKYESAFNIAIRFGFCGDCRRSLGENNCKGYDCYDNSVKIISEALEKQIPKKPYKNNENGVYEKDYCPTCHRSLFPNDHHCRCGQAIDWSEEE